MDFNERIFTSPYKFLPERWLSEDTAAIKRLDEGWAPFSKGSRGCIGKNLATAEIYITIAKLARRFKLAKNLDDNFKIREIFGVIFDTPVRMQLETVNE